MSQIGDMWHPIHSAPERIVVMTRIKDEEGERNVQPLIKLGRLWYLKDESMYVYYNPTHWRPM